MLFGVYFLQQTASLKLKLERGRGLAPVGALLRVSGFVNLDLVAVQLVNESDKLVGL
jgi:hypothetical protein